MCRVFRHFSPTTADVATVLAAAAGGQLPVVPGPRRRTYKRLVGQGRSTPVRGPNGKFLPGRGQAAFTYPVYTADEGAVITTHRAVPAGVGPSKASRLRTIRAQRRVVLDALRQARAEGKRDGTIKRLKEASRQLLHRSQLTRGL